MSKETSDAASRTVFVTVGSTRFDALITAITNATCVNALATAGVHSLIIQHGAGSAPDAAASALCASRGITLSSFTYESDISARLSSAWLVVSHAGAGSLLEATGLRRRVVAVVNDALADDHQWELAGAMHEAQLVIATDVAGLSEAIAAAARMRAGQLAMRNNRLLPGVLGEELNML